MTSSEPGTPPTKRFLNISTFIDNVRRLTSSNPILSAISGVFLFVLAWAGTNFLDFARNQVLGDANKIRAEALSDQIVERTSRIESQLQQLDTASAENFRATTHEILSELNALKPDLAQFAKDADQLSVRLMDEKASALAATGQSAQVDFALPVSGAITLCPQRFVAGLTRTGIVNGGSDGGAEYAEISLDHQGENLKARLVAGRGARLDVEEAGLVVQYLGPAADESLHRFNFKCLGN